MTTIGYFEGTDPLLLAEFAAKGYCTMPLANEWDGHGKIASHLEPGDVDLVIAYLHKLLPPRQYPKEDKSEVMSIDKHRGMKPFDLLYPAKAYNIPVIVVIPKGSEEKAKEILEDAKEFVTLVTPEDIHKKSFEILK